MNTGHAYLFGANGIRERIFHESQGGGASLAGAMRRQQQSPAGKSRSGSPGMQERGKDGQIMDGSYIMGIGGNGAGDGCGDLRPGRYQESGGGYLEGPGGIL